MARKKQETALQLELETQEEWEEMLGKEGLTVVDVYQEWAGPCKAMVSHFRRIKNEVGDELLHFAVAKSDRIDGLEKYRGKCEPCFLFIAGGCLVAVVRGANAPLLMTTLTTQLAYEHKVLDGTAERKEIRDPLISDNDGAADSNDEDEEEETAPNKKDYSIAEISITDKESIKKKVTVAIIKPDVVAEGKVEEVISQIEESGFEILQRQEKLLTEEEARNFYAHKENEEFFENLITFMTSGPSVVLALSKGETGEGALEDWRNLLGPPSVEEAKETAPDSLRAIYGRENYVNALHGSDSHETAMRELAFFFPDYHLPDVPNASHKQKVQRTLALVRPDALRERKDEILAKIEESGFRIAMQKEINLTKEQAEEFYKEHSEQPYFEQLTATMSNGPLLALALAREDAITEWRSILGPKDLSTAKEEAPESLRAQFSVDESPVNQLHGSDSPETAQKELEFFFPMQKTLAVIKPDAYQTKDEIMAKIKEAGFHIAAKKETEISHDIAEQFYHDLSDKEFFPDLVDHMTSGPTLFMVLSKEDAVDGWRSLIGPTDPELAKEQAPDSIRALFGSDIKSNAIHGSSSESQAEENIKMIFGDADFIENAEQLASEEQLEEAQESQPDGEVQESTSIEHRIELCQDQETETQTVVLKTTDSVQETSA